MFLLRGPHALLRRECTRHTCSSVSLHFGAGGVFFLVTRPQLFNENHLWGSLIQARDNRSTPGKLGNQDMLSKLGKLNKLVELSKQGTSLAS